MKMDNQQLRFQKTDNKYVGKTFGIVKVLSLSHVKNSRRYYNMICLRCNQKTIIRSDRIMSESRKCCGKCKSLLQHERAEHKYSKLRKYRKIFNSYKGNAIHRKLEFNITLEDVIKLVNSNCFYCNDVNSKGIDRVDNNIGYNTDNIVPCCTTCNMMKKNLSLDVFLQTITKIYQFKKQSSTTIPKGSTTQVNGVGNGEHPIKDEDIV